MVRKAAKKVVLKDAEGNYIVPVIDPADKGGGGLEICDISMALYVDETKGLRRYLNGQIVDINTNTQAFLNRLQEITTLHPSLLCTEEEWQSAKTMSAFGQVGKFVFNYSGENIVSVRLPRVVNVQGLFDLQNLGMTVSAGLPNIKGQLWTGDVSDAGTYVNGLSTDDEGGIFYKGELVNGYNEGGGSKNYVPRYDFSRASSIYKDDVTTVQPEAIQYPYFIQIATGSETENNIINDIELNNPYSLFECKYADHELNNLSWLKSEGQWNAKSVYTDAYDKLLKVYNGTETVEGLSVKLSTETYTDYDFVLNTADETFRLPLLDGSEDLLSNRYDDLELLASGTTYTAPANGWLVLNATSNNSSNFIQLENQTSLITSSDYGTTKTTPLKTFLPVKTSDVINITYANISTTSVTFRFIYAQGNGSLYFYVGETVQNANLIDAGRIGEQLANKADKTELATKADKTEVEPLKTSYVIQKYQNGTSWYRVWSDGWCEQGGQLAYSGNKWLTLTFLVPFRDTGYTILKNLGSADTSYSPWDAQVSFVSLTPTTARSYVKTDNAYNRWYACGYKAEN